MKTGTSILHSRLVPGIALIVLCVLAGIVTVRALQAEPSAAAPARPDSLTVEQSQWLNALDRPVRIGVTAIPPQIFRDPKSGTLDGLCIDFIREIEHHLDCRFEIIFFDTWDAMMQAAFARDIDVIYAAQKTPSRLPVFDFTDPYLTFDNKIVATEDIEGPLSMEDLAGKIVAVVDGAAIEEHLQLTYPDIQLLPVDDELVGLMRVSFKQADAMVIEIARASWYIQQKKFTNLHIVGDAHYPYKLGFACRNDWPELAAILNTALAQIPPARKNAIINQWIFPLQHRQTDVRIVLIVFAITAAALLAVFVWNRLLTLRVRRHTLDLHRELEAHQNDITALKRYETIISLSEDRMVFIDANHIFRAANDAYLKDVNKARGQVIGHRVEEIVGQEFYNRYVRERFECALNGRTVPFELWVEIEHYDDRCLQGVYYPHKNAGGEIEGVVIIIHDITEREQARRTLEENQQAMDRLFGNLRGAAYRCRYDKEWPMEFLTPGVEELTGYTNQDFYDGKAMWGGLIIEQDREFVWNEIARGVARREPFQVEYRIRDRQGRLRWLWEKGCGVYDNDGQILAVEGFITDITDRKQAEEELTESRNLLRSILDTIPVRVFWKDRDLNYLGCNRWFAHDAGLDRTEQIVGKNDRQLSWQDQVELYQHDDIEVITTGRSKLYYEEPQTTPDGKPICLLTSKVPLLTADGAIRGVLGTYQDITDRKQAEQAREQLLKELSAKNEELQSIVFIASHDLRSPLVNIRGFAGELEKSIESLKALLKEAALSDEVRKKLDALVTQDIPEALHFIKAGNKKMNSLLNGLLRLSRIGTAQINPTSLDVNRLVGGILSGLLFKIRENNIDIAVEGDLPPCRGDITLITQVFENLIDNAIKYRHPERPCIIRIRGHQDEGYCTYQIEDNGIGIAPEHQEKIFEIFHQLGPGAGGEGLGLTIVRRILNRQDGTIHIDSSQGRGSIISIKLPNS